VRWGAEQYRAPIRSCTEDILNNGALHHDLNDIEI
jgi:hypothetical protein